MTDQEIIDLWDEVRARFPSCEYCLEELKKLPKGAPMYPDQADAMGRADRRQECDAIVAFCGEVEMAYTRRLCKMILTGRND